MPKRSDEDVNTEWKAIGKAKHIRQLIADTGQETAKRHLIGSTRGNFPQQRWGGCSQNHTHIYFKDRPAVKTLLL